MANRSKMWAVLIILILIIFVGIGAAVLGIYYAKSKVGQIKNNYPNSLNNTNNISSEKKIYESPDGSWSINYPKSWGVNDLEGTIISFLPQDSKPFDGGISIVILSDRQIEDLKADFSKNHDQTQIKNVVAGSAQGVQLQGLLNDTTPNMFPPGTEELITYFPLPDGNTLSVSPAFPSSDKQISIYNDMIMSLTFSDDSYQATGENDNNKPTGKKSASGNIYVTTPSDGEKITTPYLITGQARVFENVVNYKLTDDRGQVLAEGIMNASAPDVGQFGPFSESVNFIPLSAKKGTLEVYALSPKDGEPIDVVEININF